MKISEEIRQVREERGCGMFEAKDIVVRRRLLDRINTAETFQDLKVVLEALVISAPSFTGVEDW